MQKENKNLLTSGQEKIFQQINTKEGRKLLYRFLYSVYNKQNLYSWGNISYQANKIIYAHKKTGKYSTGVKMIHMLWYLENTFKPYGMVYTGDDKFIAHLMNKFYTEERFCKYLYKKVKKNGGSFPHMKNKTDVIREFLARGFVHESEINILDYWHIKSTIIDLVYPIGIFKAQTDAIPIFEEVGIPGYTQIKKPLNYKS